MIEAGVPDCESVLWFGIAAPAGTPQPIIDKLSRAANEAVKSDEVVKSLKAQTVAALGGTPEDFRKHMEAEQKRWSAVVERRRLAEMSGQATIDLNIEQRRSSPRTERAGSTVISRARQSGTGPGLLIFSEMWGVAPRRREMADDYARRGWCALAPNMFWRSEFTGRRAVRASRPGLDSGCRRSTWQRAADDCPTAAQWLRASPHCNGKVAAIGFCMGGRIAFLAASRAGADAAIGLYALGIAKHLDEVRTMAAPLQLHYGLSDEHIPKSEIDAVAAAAEGNRNVEMHLYPGAEHGFFNRAVPPGNEKAVETATAHIDRLLAKLK